MSNPPLTVLITGATGGIGAAIARAFADSGACLLLTGRDSEALARTAGNLGIGQDRVNTLSADLTDAGHRARLVAVAQQWRGGIDVLVNNAGTSDFGLLEDQPGQRVSQTLTVNVEAPMLLTMALLKHLKTRPRGHIVNIGSVFGAIAYPGFAAYSASKFAMRGFSEALRRELSDSPVKVHYVAPRATDTPMNDANVTAMNTALGVAVDPPQRVGREVLLAVQKNRANRVIGWPEKLFARINALFPGLVDRSIAGQLPTIRKHALRRTGAADMGQPVKHTNPIRRAS